MDKKASLPVFPCLATTPTPSVQTLFALRSCVLWANILMSLMVHFLWYNNMFSSHTKLSLNSQFISNGFIDCF